MDKGGEPKMANSDCERCPPAIKLKQVCKDLDDIKSQKEKIWTRRDLDYEHWEDELSKRAKISTLVAVATIVTAIFIALFGGIWHSNSMATQRIVDELKDVKAAATKQSDKMENLRVAVAAMDAQLQEHTNQVRDGKIKNERIKPNGQ